MCCTCNLHEDSCVPEECVLYAEIIMILVLLLLQGVSYHVQGIQAVLREVIQPPAEKAYPHYCQSPVHESTELTQVSHPWNRPPEEEAINARRGDEGHLSRFLCHVCGTCFLRGSKEFADQRAGLCVCVCFQYASTYSWHVCMKAPGLCDNKSLVSSHP